VARPPEELEHARRERQQTSDELVASSARKKLVVAGPGTGKTHNFRRVLEDAGGGLALTFIRALTRELDRDLGDLAQVNTFHGYCKRVAHGLGGTEGLSSQFHYFPLLPHLVAEDLAALGQAGVSHSHIDHLFHTMDDRGTVLEASLQIGNYYDAVGHTDVVYRVQKHLAGNPGAIPEHEVIVVDEYQDFNLLDTQLIDILAQRNPVLVAGDDDQALYGFRDATPDFIRELATRDDVARFHLPYCSRCTEVVVEAVNQLVREAQRRGNLGARIDREFLCYLPEKAEDSDAHPALIHAACSVESSKSPYIRRYIAEQIAAIPPEDIEISREKDHATALVIGPTHWVQPIYKFLLDRFADVRLQVSEDVKMSLLDGYRLLARNQKSRLGWRVLIHLDPCESVDEVLRAVHEEGTELADLLPEEYRGRHLPLAATVAKLLDDEELDEEEAAALVTALGMSLDRVEEELALDPAEPDDLEKGELGEGEADGPSVICTTLVGAKGLSAEHVFIVGMNNGVFPKDSAAVTDDEVCKLIVGLSRTRKACHLISCGRWAGPPFEKPSCFFNWLGGVAIEQRTVNKDYWNS
jgi:superfamily I DNA/RNA helicase